MLVCIAVNYRWRGEKKEENGLIFLFVLVHPFGFSDVGGMDGLAAHATEKTPLRAKGEKGSSGSDISTGTRRSSILQRSYPHRYIARHEPTLEEFNRSTESDQINKLLFHLAMRWSLVKSFFSLITLGGIVIILLTVVSTCLCYHYDLEAALPLAFLGTGVFFPISFGYFSDLMHSALCQWH